MNIHLKRAAIAQLCSTASKSNNLKSIAKCANLAKSQGASMLFLPECLGFIGNSAQETLDNAETIDSPPVHLEGNDQQVDWLSDLEKIVETGKIISKECMDTEPKIATGGLAQDVSIVKGLRIIAVKSGLWISGGGIHEQGGAPSPDDKSEKPRVYNTHVIIDSEGNIVTKYRKVHLFDVSIPSQGVNLCESATTAPGSKLVVCDSPLGKLGLSTCYDVRFPEMYTKLVEEGGAEILLVPSAFTVPTGKAHWHTLLRARAIENQCYVLAAAQYGKHNEKRESYGHSVAIDPWGNIVVDAGGCDGTTSNDVLAPSIVICDIDGEKLKSIKERMPIKKHRASCSFSW